MDKSGKITNSNIFTNKNNKNITIPVNSTTKLKNNDKKKVSFSFFNAESFDEFERERLERERKFKEIIDAREKFNLSIKEVINLFNHMY
jgi:hypothetical protein